MSSATLTRAWVNLVSVATGIAVMLNRVDGKAWRGDVPCFVNVPTGAVEFVAQVLGLQGWKVDPASGKKRPMLTHTATVEVDPASLVRHRTAAGKVSLSLDVKSEEAFMAFLTEMIGSRREIGSVDPAIGAAASALLAAAGIQPVNNIQPVTPAEEIGEDEPV